VTAIETPRLRLRPFTREDGPAHGLLYADPAVTRYLPGGPFDAAAARERSARSLERFAAHWDRHGWGVWAVMDKERDALIGQCGLSHLPDGSDVEVLYALARRCWGRGLATEAAAAALRHGFLAVGLPRIVAVTAHDHAASRRVMEHLGMAYESERELFGMRLVCYALTAVEWGRAARGAT
jgi:RimJ/RimL family protein N-acetyltransferase